MSPANNRNPDDFAPRHDMIPGTKDPRAVLFRAMRLSLGDGNWKQRHVHKRLGISLSLYTAQEQGKRTISDKVMGKMAALVEKVKVSGRKINTPPSGISRAAAHQMVCRAVKKGELAKQGCAVCGKKKANAHHDDYQNPLDVTWLCQSHHAEKHKSLGWGITTGRPRKV